MNANVPPSPSVGDLRHASPEQRGLAIFQVYPADRLGQYTEGFHMVEHWGAQWRGQWAITPQTVDVASGTSGTQTVEWVYPDQIPLATGYAVLVNQTSTETTWTPAWVMDVVSGTAVTVTLSDIGSVTVAAGAAARVAMNAPAVSKGTVQWSVELSSALTASGTLTAGLLAW